MATLSTCGMACAQSIFQGTPTVNMGFYCQRLRLMFSADLFASYRGIAHFPPGIFNSAPEQLPESVATALAFDLGGVIPNHCDRATPEEHLQRLRQLHRESQRA